MSGRAIGLNFTKLFLILKLKITLCAMLRENLIISSHVSISIIWTKIKLHPLCGPLYPPGKCSLLAF